MNPEPDRERPVCHRRPDLVVCELEVSALGYRVESLPVYSEQDATAKPQPSLRVRRSSNEPLTPRHLLAIHMARERRARGLPLPAGYEELLADMVTPEPGPPEPVLVEKVPPPPHPGGLPPPRTYNPLADHPALVTEFAELNADDPEAVRAFAERYGMLGEPLVALRELPDTEQRKGVAQLLNAEPLARWKMHVAAVHEALRVYELWRKEERDGLAGCLAHRPKRDGGSVWDYGPPPDRGTWFPPHSFVVEGARKAEREDVMTAAATVLAMWANTHLAGHAHPALFIDEVTRKPTYRVAPTTLLGAVWQQFAVAVSGGVGPRQCDVCKRWFMVDAADARKARQMFCDEFCKLKDYRRRQGEAVRLHAEKVKPVEIAARTGTKLATVKKWIAAERKKKG